MKQDKYLIAIIIVIIVLMVVAVGVFFVRQSSQNYVVEDSPEGIVNNFIFAIQKKDYERAYEYLSDEEEKPSYSDFQKWYRQDSQNDLGVQIFGSEIFQDSIGTQNALVDIKITRFSNDPFNGSYRTDGVVELRVQDEQWKIISFPDRLWSWEWYRTD